MKCVVCLISSGSEEAAHVCYTHLWQSDILWPVRVGSIAEHKGSNEVYAIKILKKNVVIRVRRGHNMLWR